jgi:hypothetical protein
MTTVNLDAVVAKYVELRNKKKALEDSISEQIDEINANLTKLEAYLKVQMDGQGLTSVKSKHGTAFLTTSDYANVANWDDVLNFIITNNSFDLLNKAINKTAVRAYIDTHKAIPPGVNYGTKIEVSIRKPRAKVED